MHVQIETDSLERIPISVITVCFNAESLIESTLNSIISQKGEFEYIIIDGDSTDGTLEILKKYSNQIDITVSEQDLGIYDAMNKGLRLATKKYVLFINAGDQLVDESTLLKLSEFMQESDIIYGETLLVNSHGDVLGTRSQLTTRPLPKSLQKKSFLNGQPVSHQSFIVKKELVADFNLKYRCSSDIDWMIRAISNAEIVTNAKFPISKYLLGGESDKKLRLCWIERFQILLKYYDLLSVLGAHIKFAIRFIRFGSYKQ